MAFVVSAGRLGAVDRPAVHPVRAVHLSAQVVHDYATIWRTQPQVRTVVSFLARNIAQLGLHTYRRISDVDRERVTEHPLARLLSRPSPYATRYRAVDALVSDLGIFDNAYWLKVATGEAQPAVLRLDPDRVTPVGDNAFYADGYEFQGNRSRRVFPADQVVHFRGYNPTDPRSGSSPIETLRSILAEEWQANLYREQLWRNGARVSGYLRRPTDAPPWSREARDRFRLQWHNQYTGDGPQTGGTPVLEDGMEFNAASVTPEQAQYLEARKLTREEVAAAYHVPPPLVGILENATYSNIREQHKHLYQDCLGPWLAMIAEEIELQLVPDFDDTAGLYVEFNLAEKLRGSFEDQASQLQTAIGAPYMTRNEGRGKLNLPQIDGGDDLVTPLNVLIGGQASPTDAASPPKTAGVVVKARASQQHTDQAVEVLSRYFARQGSVVSSQLGAAKAQRKVSLADVYDTVRWVAELTAELFGLAVGVAGAAGRAALKAIDMDPAGYDEDRTLPWIQTHAQFVAESIEAGTRDGIEQALADPDPGKAVVTLFAEYATSRTEELAATEVTALSGFATAEAVEMTVELTGGTR